MVGRKWIRSITTKKGEKRKRDEPGYFCRGNDSYLRNPDSRFLFAHFFSSLQPLNFPQSTYTTTVLLLERQQETAAAVPFVMRVSSACCWARVLCFMIGWNAITLHGNQSLFCPVRLSLYCTTGTTRRRLLDWATLGSDAVGKRREKKENKNVLVGAWLSTLTGQRTGCSEQNNGNH